MYVSTSTVSLLSILNIYQNFRKKMTTDPNLIECQRLHSALNSGHIKDAEKILKALLEGVEENNNNLAREFKGIIYSVFID